MHALTDLVFSQVKYLQTSTASLHPASDLMVPGAELLSPQVGCQTKVWILSQSLMPLLYICLSCIGLQQASQTNIAQL